MAASNFAACIAFTLRYEGGYADHPSDPGGATNLGITIGTLSAWRKRSVTKAEMRALKRDEAEAIYRANYWDLVKGDRLPAGVDLVVFDFAVNSGVARAAKALQAAVGARQDGVIGEATLAALQTKHDGDVVKAVCDNRLTFLQRLKTWATFGKGWKARVIAVRAMAVSMVSGSTIKVSVAPPPADAAAKAPTTDVAPQKTAPGRAAIAVGAGGALAGVGSAGDLISAGKAIRDYSDTLPWLALAGSIVVVVGIVWFVWPQVKRLVRGQGREEVA